MKKLFTILALSLLTLSCSTDDLQEDIQPQDPIETPVETRTAILYVDSYQTANGTIVNPTVTINNQSLSYSQYSNGRAFQLRAGDVVGVGGYIESFQIDGQYVAMNYGPNNNYYLVWTVQ